ncbi:MAG: large conductance mechanosensitive channel protein MscL [Ruminococcus sp.]|nr:large conductance mechanosensitive channel protein MscL [Ruminococcus sp.]
MKKFFGEFKEFVMRGNVLDLAVGVIIGAAFGAIVTSLTDDILSPLIGSIFQANFDSLSVNINGATLMYGKFITAVVNFLIMAFVIFLIVKGINKLMAVGKKPEPEEEPTTKTCPFCCEEVSIKATKCPHCASSLPEEEE